MRLDNLLFLPKSSLGIVPPASRLKLGAVISPELWIKERRDTDGAEGLWRIHDGLYDFTDFIKDHPGGSEWLTTTKGTDISEAFESHHITRQPEDMLSKFYIRKAKTRRNFPFTFEEDGFYKTLKREVRSALKVLPNDEYNTSKLYSDILAIGLFLVSTLAVRYWSYLLGVTAGILLGLLTTAGHNFIHKKNSFRMFYFQFSMYRVRDWRITHVLSHHLYTNTIIDCEMNMTEPFFQYYPIQKFIGGYYSLVIAPFVWLLNFHHGILLSLGEYKKLTIADLSGLTLPLFMYIYGRQTLLYTLIMWNIILLVGSFEFTFIGLSAAHHHPDVFHDGDTPRSTEKYDWGLSQLDAVMERYDINESGFLVLTAFGDHCLHHLFPTLDHSVLRHLYPILQKVMRQFDVHLRVVSQLEAINGNLRQLIKVQPNMTPPDLNNIKFKLL